MKVTAYGLVLVALFVCASIIRLARKSADLVDGALGGEPNRGDR